MKQYKLLKDLPGIKAGEIGVYKNEYYHFKRKRKGFIEEQVVYNEQYIKQYPDFFEEVIELQKRFTIQDIYMAVEFGCNACLTHDYGDETDKFIRNHFPQHIDQLKHLK